MGDIVGYDSNGNSLEVGDYVMSDADDDRPGMTPHDYYGEVFFASDQQRAENGYIEVRRLDQVEGDGREGRWVVLAALTSKVTGRHARMHGLQVEDIDSWHDAIDAGVDEVCRAFNDTFAETGTRFRLKEEHKDNIKEIAKQVVPFMTIPETMVLMQVFEVLIKNSTIQVMLDKMGIDPNDHQAMHEAMEGISGRVFGGTSGMDPSDTEHTRARISKKGDKPKTMNLADEGEDPADAIMRMSNTNMN